MTVPFSRRRPHIVLNANGAGVKMTSAGHCMCLGCFERRPLLISVLASKTVRDLQMAGARDPEGRLHFVCPECDNRAWIAWDETGAVCLHCGSRAGHVRRMSVAGGTLHA